MRKNHNDDKIIIVPNPAFSNLVFNENKNNVIESAQLDHISFSEESLEKLRISDDMLVNLRFSNTVDSEDDVEACNENNYLVDIPLSSTRFGISKLLTVRKSIIHVKHIMTEIFVRKTIDIEKQLSKIDMSLFSYLEFLTNHIRHIHHYPRTFVQSPNKIISRNLASFFDYIKLFKGLNNVIILDFDGVITKRNFENLYKYCVESEKVYICTANPTVTDEWFNNRGLPKPTKIFANKGKIAKLKCLVEIQRKHDMCFYVDNESEYLDFAWLFGIFTYQYRQNKICLHSLKTK